MFGQSRSIDNVIIDLRMGCKSLERQSKKCEKEEKVQRERVKKALSSQNIEVAQIYAENAIRKHNEALNYLRMASRLDAVSSRLKTASAMQSLSKGMGSVVKGLDKAMASMDLEKIDKVMREFERQSETIDVTSQVMETTMGSATAQMTPAAAIQNLIKQVAEENGLEVMGQLENVQSGGLASTEKSRTSAEEDDLTNRLSALRGQ